MIAHKYTTGGRDLSSKNAKPPPKWKRLARWILVTEKKC